ncbi:MAG: DUF1559 domain-containing protein [Abditibacteriota bacterium]|nr:DUF1559 domain-containing protein [Abditibacteriota bacterium]
MFKKGFTLIELLVVIAIIAILAAILFPVFAQAREKARAANCLSNMKQIGTATMLYVDDYDETYPPSNGSGYNGWAIKVLPYAGNKGQAGTWSHSTIFKCPSDDGFAAWMQQNGHIGRNSYCGNVYIFRESGMCQFILDGDTSEAVITNAEIANPAETILVAETWRYGWGTLNYIAYGDTCFPPINPYQTYLLAFGNQRSELNDPACKAMKGYHNGMDNWTFADGHAKAMKPEATTTPINMWPIKR